MAWFPWRWRRELGERRRHVAVRRNEIRARIDELRARGLEGWRIPGTALESRGVIEQAKGILMASSGCDAEKAFDILRRASQRENRKLHTIAEEVVQRTMRDGGVGGRPGGS